jgi:excisionase family DNA binding protein
MFVFYSCLRETEMTKELLTLEQTARVLTVTYARAAELARQGVLPVVRLGRQIRVSPDDLNQFIANGGKALPGGWRRSPGESAAA